MPFAIDQAHRQFFHSHGWVQFDQVFNESQLDQFHRQVSLNLFGSQTASMDPQSAYEKGRDLHLKDSWAQKCAIEMGSIAAGLWNERPIMLLGDQLLHGPMPSRVHALQLERAKQHRSSPRSTPNDSHTDTVSALAGVSLEEIWSAQPLLGCIIIALDDSNASNKRALSVESPFTSNLKMALKDTSGEDEAADQPIALLSSLRAGSACCLKATTQAIGAVARSRRFWMFTFGTDQSRYVQTNLDPYSDYYRRRGVPDQGRLVMARLPILVR